MNGKIAVEEHFTTEEHLRYDVKVGLRPEVKQDSIDAMLDFGERRLTAMDDNGIEVSVLSLCANGVEGEPDRERAVATAASANDTLAAVVAERPDRYIGLASVAMQDPEAAAAEAQRAIGELGLRGVNLNGYAEVGDHETGEYFDLPKFDPFWAAMEALQMPVYLHPRSPLPSQQLIYEGHPELVGPTWAWGVETATHALRLITGKVFDRFPRVQLILGHLGETLPFALYRMEQRLQHIPGLGLERPATAYLRENLYVSTSGNFHDASLLGAISEVGVDRVLFAVDYPFEQSSEAAGWFDKAPIDEEQRQKIGRDNARRLFRID